MGRQRASSHSPLCSVWVPAPSISLLVNTSHIWTLQTPSPLFLTSSSSLLPFTLTSTHLFLPRPRCFNSYHLQLKEWDEENKRENENRWNWNWIGQSCKKMRGRQSKSAHVTFCVHIELEFLTVFVSVCVHRKHCYWRPVCMLQWFREPLSPFIAEEWGLFTHAVRVTALTSITHLWLELVKMHLQLSTWNRLVSVWNKIVRKSFQL